MRFNALAGFLLLVPALCLQGQESVCFKTGYCLEAESHMIADGMMVVQSGKGTLQFPVEAVDGITALPVLVKATLPPAEPNVSVAVENTTDLLLRAAILQGLEPEFLRSVAIVESGLHQNVISSKGAVGLMQLMPMTAGELHVNPWQIEQNAIGGAAFLRQLLIKYRGNSALALAAYNAGPGAVEKYKGIPPFPETRLYVTKVLSEYAHQQRLQSQKDLQLAKAARALPAPPVPALPPLQAQTVKPDGEAARIQ